MITRKLGKLLRGDATPFQLFTACLLASVLGFLPGFSTAAGLVVCFLLLLILVNANLALAAFVGLGVKLVSLLLTPASFALGRWLLDGPTQPLFRSMINAPVLALFGFEYYLTTGGLAMGLIFGCAIGVAVVRGITGFRKKMATLESGSEKFKAFHEKGWVKALMFIFVGGKRKQTYEATISRGMGNPIRPLGLVFAGLAVALLVILQLFASGPIVTAALQRGLEKANGATVDLQEAELNLKDNRLVLTGLAMTDPNDLKTDLFRAASVEANISGMSLLTKRLQLDRVVVNEGSHGEPRAVPGKLIGKAPEPAPPAEDAQAKTLEDYIKDAKVWKERLAQAKRWLDKLSGPDSKEEADGPEDKTETLRERLEREIRELGYARVQASHLIQGAPTLTISQLIAEKVKVGELNGETLDITATNLSTHPALLGKTPGIVVRSSGGTLGLEVKAGSWGGEINALNFFYKGLPVDRVASELKLGGNQTLKGGTIDLESAGQWTSAQGVTVDLPLNISLHDTTFTLGGSPTKVAHLVLPVGVRGPLDNPRLTIDDQQLGNALVQAGLSRAKEELKDKAAETISKELDGKVGDKLGEDGKSLLNGILGGKKDP